MAEGLDQREAWDIQNTVRRLQAGSGKGVLR